MFISMFSFCHGPIEFFGLLRFLDNGKIIGALTSFEVMASQLQKPSI
jgi:hypothetical protein